MHLVIGLGNPGPRYAGTRHNAGFLVVEALAARRGVRFEKSRHADVVRAGALVLAKPTTFMNLSGLAAQSLMTRHGVRPAAVVVIHDDLDLPFGRIRVKAGGGAGGQRGVQDIADRVGPDFVRVRIGIGRPPPGWTSERWVLAPFEPQQLDALARVVATAADAVELVLTSGLEAAMNAVNGLDLAPEAAPAPAAPDGSGA
jgi:peptidyl-tRNA hydrolase, PTH1 family